MKWIPYQQKKSFLEKEMDISRSSEDYSSEIEPKKVKIMKKS